jgi:hypothetical protein
MKILPVRIDLFHEEGRKDRQTEMMKIIFVLRNFSPHLKNIEV